MITPRRIALVALAACAVSFAHESFADLEMREDGFMAREVRSCLRDLCGPLETTPIHAFNLALTGTAWVRPELVPNPNAYPPAPNGQSSFADILAWIPQETAEEARSPLRATSLRLATTLAELSEKLPYGSLPPHLKMSRTRFTKYVNATARLHVLRAREVLSKEQVRGFLPRFEKLGRAMEATLVEEFGMPRESARIYLSQVHTTFKSLNNCTELPITLWPHPLSENEERQFNENLKSNGNPETKIRFDRAREDNEFARQTIAECYRARESDRETDARYQSYAASVDRLSSLYAATASPDLAAVAQVITEMNAFWEWNVGRVRDLSSTASYGWARDIDMSMDTIQHPYYGEAILAHEFGHDVFKELPRGGFVGLDGKYHRNDLAPYQAKNKCLLERQAKPRRHESTVEDFADHFSSRVVSRLFPQLRRASKCRLVDDLNRGDYDDAALLGFLGPLHSTGVTRAIYEALDNGYLPASCQKIIEALPINRSCTSK